MYPAVTFGRSLLIPARYERNITGRIGGFKTRTRHFFATRGAFFAR